MKGEDGKETPKKEMDYPSFLDVFSDVTHDTFQRFLICLYLTICVEALAYCWTKKVIFFRKYSYTYVYSCRGDFFKINLDLKAIFSKINIYTVAYGGFNPTGHLPNIT